MRRTTTAGEMQRRPLREEKSDGKALFLMAVEKGKPGLFEQVTAKIN
jgi:hypothetical protein